MNLSPPTTLTATEYSTAYARSAIPRPTTTGTPPLPTTRTRWAPPA
jgi:hypothetical protein